MSNEGKCIQDYLPGHDCFGCGEDNPHGLKIKSIWRDSKAICDWQPQHYHQGWAGLSCGGVIATVVDCHAIATATAAAFDNENRELGTEPAYLFATGSMNITYFKPASVERPMHLRAWVEQEKYGKKYTIKCEVSVEGVMVAEATVIALLVYRSDDPSSANEAFRPQ